MLDPIKREEAHHRTIVNALMDLDKAKIDDAVLALLYLGLHDGVRAWKGFDWDVMNRLHERGDISDPRSKAKSVVFSDARGSSVQDNRSRTYSARGADRTTAAGVSKMSPRQRWKPEDAGEHQRTRENC